MSSKSALIDYLVLSSNLNINKINLNCYAINKFFEHKSPQITPLIMIKLDSSFLM